MANRKPPAVASSMKSTGFAPPALEFGEEMALEAHAEERAHAERIAGLRAQANAEKLSVGDYFERVMGEELEGDDNDHEHPNSPYNHELSVLSGCGVPCANAIDAAALLLHHVHSAFGDDEPQLEDNVIRTCERVILCYVYG